MINTITELKNYLNENTNISYWSKYSNIVLVNNNYINLPISKVDLEKELQ